MNVYVLTDGDYSDYHIIGCFSDEELANKAKKIHGGDIELWELNEIGKNGLYHFIVHFYEDNTITVAMSNPISEKNIGHYKNKIWVEVMAKNKEHAVKIASEKMMQYKVEHNL